MYSREKRLQAVELYIRYERSAAAVIHELGYPDPRMLAKWYKAHLEEQEYNGPRKQDMKMNKIRWLKNESNTTTSHA